MGYLWATEPSQKATVKYIVCRKKMPRMCSQSSMAEQMRPRDSCQSHVYWKVNVKPTLIPSVCLVLPFSSTRLPACISFFSPLSHRITHTRGCLSLWKEPAGSSLSCPLFLSCFRFTYCCILDIKPGASFSLRLSSFLSLSLKEHSLIPCPQSFWCIYKTKTKNLQNSKRRKQRN